MKYIREFSAVFLVVAFGLWGCPDLISLKTAAFAVAIVCLMIGALALVIGVANGWGVLPAVSFREDVQRALSTPGGASTVIGAFLIFLGLIVLAVFRAS